MAVSDKDLRWCIYALICRGNYIYVGVTNNLEQRLRLHEDGKGSKFVRSRRPFELAKVIWCESGTEARKKEYRLKRMRRPEKIKALEIDVDKPRHSCVFRDTKYERLQTPNEPFKMPLRLRESGQRGV